jgi:hypothetical protein
MNASTITLSGLQSLADQLEADALAKCAAALMRQGVPPHLSRNLARLLQPESNPTNQ